MDKERRGKLERKLQSGNSVPVKDVRLDANELRTLLDMADERDRYRALLGDVLEDNGHAGYTTPETLNRIDAALEGKNND